MHLHKPENNIPIQLISQTKQLIIADHVFNEIHAIIMACFTQDLNLSVLM